MTRDEFSVKYKVFKPIEGGDGRSYTAEHRPTGRAVLVHFLPNDSPGAAALPELISRLSPRDRSKITETLSVEDATVVVSEFVDMRGSFQRWVGLRSETPGPPAASASGVIPAESSAPAPAAGAFTQLFRHEEASPAGASGARSGSPEPPPPPPPGSFTDLFHALPNAEARSAPPPPRAATPAVPIRNLRVPAPAPEESPAGPGFGPEPIQQPPPVLPPVAAVSPPAVPPRGFILPTMAARDARAEGYPPPPIQQGPSDYTRILAGLPEPIEPTSAAAGAPAPGAAPPVAPPAAPPRSYLPLWLALNVVLIVATGLIVYFALKRR